MSGPFIGLNGLASLCRRMSTSLEAGIDVRTVWTREAERGGGQFRVISEAVGAGQSLKDAMGATGEFFPRLVREMVAVGEETGRLPEVFGDLAQHYESRIKLRREFLGAITWPLAQLGIAILLVAVVIWLSGFVERTSHTRVDILGVGLIGTRGLVIYFTLLVLIGGAVIAFLRGFQRGVLWTRSVEQFVDRVPCVGKTLRTLALSRLTWTLEMTMASGMEVRRAMRLALQNTLHSRFNEASAGVDASLSAGESVYEALVKSEVFPQEFLDTLQVGEESGKMVETLERLARQYRVQAQSALGILTKVAGCAIWGLIAALIIVVIFRVANFYFSMISQAGGL
jgi:type IV pilus assembly protein PilC